MTLYHYLHCPYCIRVRLAFGKLGLSYTSQVLAYNDEQTPLSLTGKKMAPFIVDNEGKAFNESLDIIERFDTKNALKTQEYKNQGPGHEFLALISEPLFQLSMPYMWKYGEFDDANKLYFQKKKEVKRGSLAALQKQRPQYEALILTLLAEQEANLVRGFFQSETLTLNDILVASHLWCLYMVTEFQFPSKWHEYLQRVKRDCHFDFDRELFNS